VNSATTGGLEITLPPGHRVTRFYTLARRFPTLIGRLPSGSDIPFGPYTVGQFVTAVCLLVIGYRTMPFWGGSRGLLLNGPLLLGLTALVVIFMRKVPWRGRGPVPVLRGMLGSYSATDGTYKGKSLPARQATPVVSAIVIADAAAMIAAEALLQKRQTMTALPAVEAAFIPASAGTTRAGKGRGSNTQAIASGPASASAQAQAQAQARTPTAAAALARSGRVPVPGRDVLESRAKSRPSSPPRPGVAAAALERNSPLSGVQRLRRQAQAATAASTPGSPAQPLTTAGSTGRH
jgi:hypothetical protein